MQTVEELENYYEAHIAEHANELEVLRKQITKRILQLVVTSIILVVLAFVFLPADAPIYAVGIVILSIVAGAIMTAPKYSKLKKNFKKQIIGNLIKYIDEDLTYDHKRGVNQHEFSASNLFLTRIDRYKSMDLVQGKIGETDIRFSEVQAMEVRRRQTKNGTKTTTHTIFKGLFFIGDFHKYFKGETYLLPNSTGMLGSFGKMFNSMNFRRPKSVTLEDPEFNRTFNVYSSDQVECRYILTPSLMQRILNFRKAHPRRAFFISFVNDSVYVAISFSKSLFEPNLFKPMNDFGQIKEYYEDLHLAVSIVEEFNLNTRIWTKE